jgi:hypothetical protein
VEDMTIETCAHCILVNSRKHEASYRMFSWPLDSSFLVLHADLWSPGDTDDEQHCFMNIMCDMTQFGINTPVPSWKAHVLASYLMQEVLLKVGICVMIIVDDGNTFTGIFKEACDTMNIRYHLIAKCNHKTLSV